MDITYTEMAGFMASAVFFYTAEECSVIKVDLIKPDVIILPDPPYLDYSNLKPVFNAANPGVCDIPCEGTCGIPALNSNLQWEMTTTSGGVPVSGSTLSSTPDPAKGATPTFHFTGLPEHNSSFGSDILVSLRYPGFSWHDRQLAVFFSRDAKNHPGIGSGTTANWYYYWIEGNVVNGLSDFVYGGDHPSLRGQFQPPSTLKIYLRAPRTMPGCTRVHQYWIVDESVDPPTYDSVTGFWTGPLSKRPSFSFETREGIYNCRSIVLHEKKHKENFDAINTGGDTDNDQDGCPDSLEGTSGGAPYYFSAKFKDTYDWESYASGYAEYGDNEMLARMAGEGVNSSDVKPDDDWSDTNGCNW